MKEYKNYTILDKFSLLYKYYCFIDVKKYYADNLLIKNKIRVWFGKEFAKKGTDYVAIFCKVRKNKSAEFERVMEELQNKMLICGYNDYEEVCRGMFEQNG